MSKSFICVTDNNVWVDTMTPNINPQIETLEDYKNYIISITEGTADLEDANEVIIYKCVGDMTFNPNDPEPEKRKEKQEQKEQWQRRQMGKVSHLNRYLEKRGKQNV